MLYILIYYLFHRFPPYIFKISYIIKNNSIFLKETDQLQETAFRGFLVETVKANGLEAMKYIKYILLDMLENVYLENLEYLDDYLP